MHHNRIAEYRHPHVFLGASHGEHERRTWMVVALTATMMVVEIAAGYITGSLALLADGWHMATHAGALSLSALAYWLAIFLLAVLDGQDGDKPTMSITTATPPTICARPTSMYSPTQ